MNPNEDPSSTKERRPYFLAVPPGGSRGQGCQLANCQCDLSSSVCRPTTVRQDYSVRSTTSAFSGGSSSASTMWDPYASTCGQDTASSRMRRNGRVGSWYPNYFNYSRPPITGGMCTLRTSNNNNNSSSMERNNNNLLDYDVAVDKKPYYSGAPLIKFNNNSHSVTQENNNNRNSNNNYVFCLGTSSPLYSLPFPKLRNNSLTSTSSSLSTCFVEENSLRGSSAHREDRSYSGKSWSNIMDHHRRGRDEPAVESTKDSLLSYSRRSSTPAQGIVEGVDYYRPSSLTRTRNQLDRPASLETESIISSSSRRRLFDSAETRHGEYSTGRRNDFEDSFSRRYAHCFDNTTSVRRSNNNPSSSSVVADTVETDSGVSSLSPARLRKSMRSSEIPEKVTPYKTDSFEEAQQVKRIRRTEVFPVNNKPKHEESTSSQPRYFVSKPTPPSRKTSREMDWDVERYISTYTDSPHEDECYCYELPDARVYDSLKLIDSYALKLKSIETCYICLLCDELFQEHSGAHTHVKEHLELHKLLKSKEERMRMYF